MSARQHDHNNQSDSLLCCSTNLVIGEWGEESRDDTILLNGSCNKLLAQSSSLPRTFIHHQITTSTDPHL